MAKRKLSPTERLMRTEQPINWGRAFLSGVIGATLMIAFLGIFNMFGLLKFSYPVYLGSLFFQDHYGSHVWLVGLFANWLAGGIFGIFYGYFFEYFFSRANTRNGIIIGFWHAVVASVALFPFFSIVHEFLGTGVYPDFGFFGWGMGSDTPVLLLLGHLLFGATMGAFYGPVRVERVRAKRAEPGEMGKYGDPDLISEEMDARDRASGY